MTDRRVISIAAVSRRRGGLCPSRHTDRCSDGRKKGVHGGSRVSPVLDEQGQEIGGRTLPFDDRAVARVALRRLVRAS